MEPSLAGPKRPQDRVPLRSMKGTYQTSLGEMLAAAPAQDDDGPATGEKKAPARSPAERAAASAPVADRGVRYDLGHGAVVIAAITSCTNTSNPAVLLGAGLLAKRAVERGLTSKPWVKTSLAPGSKVVMDYLQAAGVLPYLEALGFHLVGYGCTTCIGNSGPLPEHIAEAVTSADLVVASVLSGNRNFEGRINPHVRMNFLASPPLVVAYALAGTVAVDLTKEPLAVDRNGHPVYLREVWPTDEEIRDAVSRFVKPEQFREQYARRWRGTPTGARSRSSVPRPSTGTRRAPTSASRPSSRSWRSEPAPLTDIQGARVLAVLGDSVTTDHISPAGNIAKKARRRAT